MLKNKKRICCLLKTVDFSRTSHVQVLTQGSINGYNRLFGGKLMEWIDIVAAVVARRHCEKNVTTAVVDTLQFKGAAYPNDTIVLDGYITYVGKTSMEVCVKTYVEALSGEKHLLNTAYVVMVALDENEKPTKVPPLRLISDEEEYEWMLAEKRCALRKKRRIENY